MIDADGQLSSKSLPWRTAGVIDAAFRRPPRRRPLFARFGNCPARCSASLLLIAALPSAAARR